MRNLLHDFCPIFDDLRLQWRRGRPVCQRASPTPTPPARPPVSIGLCFCRLINAYFHEPPLPEFLVISEIFLDIEKFSQFRSVGISVPKWQTPPLSRTFWFGLPFLAKLFTHGLKLWTRKFTGQNYPDREYVWYHAYRVTLRMQICCKTFWAEKIGIKRQVCFNLTSILLVNNRNKIDNQFHAVM